MSTLQPTKQAAKKSRSPIERVLVWGLILVGVVVIGFEARARFAYSNTVNAITPAIQESSEGTALTMAEVEQRKLISGSPTTTKGATTAGIRTDTYVWKGAIKTYTLKILVGHDDLVLGTENE
jgi:hypothetical protein